MAFEFKIEEQKAVQIISFVGRITTDSDLDDLRSTLEKHSSTLIFDLSELAHTNSSGINFFIRNLTRCRVGGGELVLNGLNGGVKNLFELAKIDGLFTIYDNLEDSLKHFNN